MMQWENLFYALTQFVHNFGALAVVGGALAGLKTSVDKTETKKKLAVLVLIGWGMQAMSGMTFGGISLYYYGETPDLHAIAKVAFIVKLCCATAGILLAFFYVIRANTWNGGTRRGAWWALSGFGVTALTAAAFLRWFS